MSLSYACIDTDNQKLFSSLRKETDIGGWGRKIAGFLNGNVRVGDAPLHISPGYTVGLCST